MGHPRPHFRLFSVHSNANTTLQQINVKNGPIWRWDLNSQPLGHESHLKITRPELPPFYVLFPHTPN